MICVGLCREATQESNSGSIVQLKPCTQRRFNEVTLLVQFHMPGKPLYRKLEIPGQAINKRENGVGFVSVHGTVARIVINRVTL